MADQPQNQPQNFPSSQETPTPIEAQNFDSTGDPPGDVPFEDLPSEEEANKNGREAGLSEKAKRTRQLELLIEKAEAYFKDGENEKAT